MSALATMLLLATVLCDVAGQVSFKLGLEREPTRWLASPWVLAGVAIYAVEFVLWIAALSMLPLSRAVPVAALSYVGVVLASKALLGEHVSARRWAGTGAVTLGVALVCWQGSP